MSLKNAIYKDIPITSIYSEPRNRSDIGDLRGLKESIRKEGLIHPLIVAEVAPGLYRLIAGERRRQAIEELYSGEDSQVSAKIYTGLSEHEMRALELAEDLHRKNLTTVEQEQGFLRLHETMSEKVPGWTQQDTADLTGRSPSSVSRDLKFWKELEEVGGFTPSEISSLRKKVKNQREFRRIGGLLKKEKKEIIEAAHAEAKIKQFAGRKERWLLKSFSLGDLPEIQERVADSTQDLILASENPGSSIDHQSALLSWNKLKHNGWFLCWEELEHITRSQTILEKAGFSVSYAIQHVHNQRKRGSWARNRFSNQFKVLIYARKGEATIYKPEHGDVFRKQGRVDMMEDLLRTFCRAGSSLLCLALLDGAFLRAGLNLSMLPIGFCRDEQRRREWIINIEGKGREEK